MANFDAPPITDATTEKEMPVIQPDTETLPVVMMAWVRLLWLFVVCCYVYAAQYESIIVQK